MGDEAGSSGGIKSGTVSGPGYFLSGSATVYIEKLPAVRLTSRASGNNENAQGAVLVPGQPIVYFAFDAAAPIRATGEGGLDPLFDGEPFTTSLDSEGTGIVRIDRFARDAVRLFFNAQRSLTERGARAFVIDLRGCPGGDLEAAYALAAEFLPAGVALGSVIDADGDVSERVTHRDGPYDFPLLLLVDRERVFRGVLARVELEADPVAPPVVEHGVLSAREVLLHERRHDAVHLGLGRQQARPELRGAAGRVEGVHVRLQTRRRVGLSGAGPLTASARTRPLRRSLHGPSPRARGSVRSLRCGGGSPRARATRRTPRRCSVRRTLAPDRSAFGSHRR
jgi:hypothetical protein